MIGVLFRVSALRLLRDPAGLLMVFILPPVVFLVFASVFAGASAGRLEVRAGLFDPEPGAASRRFAASLERGLGAPLARPPSEAALRSDVLSGALDAGVVLAGRPGEPGAAILVHPARRASGAVLSGRVEAAAREAFAPDIARQVALRVAPFLALTPAQTERLRRLPYPRSPPPPFAREELLGRGDPLVTYYAGAVSMLFVMFTAMQGAMILIDERLAGLRLRLALASGGPFPLLAGRFLWLAALGAAQTLALFAVAGLFYGAPVLADPAALLVTICFAAAAGAGPALALAAAAANREQAQTVSTVLILVLAAVGGAMAPRFLMPRFMQDLGWLTPHAWAIETYQAILWRTASAGSEARGWGVLGGVGAAGFLIAWVIERGRRL